MRNNTGQTARRLRAVLSLMLCGAFLFQIEIEWSIAQTTSAQSSATRQLRVIFIDSDNHSLDDVQEQDIEVFEDGARQTATLTKVTLPARYALVVDNSGSLRSQFRDVVSTARAILNSNSSTDETALVRFVDTPKIQAIQPFTSEKARLFSAVDTLKIEGGSTALVDAIYTSVELLSERTKVDTSQQLSNALVVITDGENRESEHSREALSKLVRSRNIRIFSIGLVSELDDESAMVTKSPRKKAEELLQGLAKDSGGRAFFVKKEADFQTAIDEIVRDLRNHYLVTYNSASNKANLKIEIKVTTSAKNKKRKAIFNPRAVS